MRIEVFFILSTAALCCQATYNLGRYALGGYNYGTQRYPAVAIVAEPSAAYTVPTVALNPVSSVAYNSVPVSSVAYNSVPVSSVAYNSVPVSSLPYNSVPAGNNVYSYVLDLDNTKIYYDAATANTYDSGLYNGAVKYVAVAPTLSGLSGYPLKK